MAIEVHIQQLEERHKQIEVKLEEMLNHPSVSDTEIADMKRQKLHLKDRISQLQAESSVH